MSKKFSLTSVGSPITDYLARVDDDFLRQNVGGEKNGMRLIDSAQMAELLGKLPDGYVSAIGGAAMNTARALARLGVATCGLGKLGNDETGRHYIKKMANAGVSPAKFKYAGFCPSARCLSLITPDAARTLRTDLGAASKLLSEDLVAADFADTDYVYIEGYLLWNQPLAERIFTLARDADCEICLNFGSFEMVRQLRPQLQTWLRDYVGVVFGNLEEAREYFRDQDGNAKEMAQSLMTVCGCAAVTDGANGAYIAESGKETTHCPAQAPTELVDTTGAGDFWAAGFLYGRIKNYDHARCGQIATALAREIIAVAGVELSAEKWEALRAEVSGS
ncbi:adenosine kinase [Planctomycetales bacterium]|nr:adenosine kinase [Planctomycetales bacterium]GHT00775.1 adenosine kinase [Planctomycetales bacterium]GHV22331.1 adenosine kinase [Planctomycetales bacterium]